MSVLYAVAAIVTAYGLGILTSFAVLAYLDSRDQADARWMG